MKMIVAASRSGSKYLNTEAEVEQPNNLFSVLECR